jgi:hypothetical protein
MMAVDGGSEMVLKEEKRWKKVKIKTGRPAS